MHRKGRPVRSQALRRADRCEIVRSGDTVRFGDSSPAAHVHTLRRAKSWGTARAGQWRASFGSERYTGPARAMALYRRGCRTRRPDSA